MFQGFWFRVDDLGSRVDVLGFRFEDKVQRLCFGVQGLELMFQGVGFRVDDLGFRVEVLSLDYLTIYYFCQS